MLFALSLCYSKPITRSATGYNHIFPSACFPSCPWVQYQASPRFTPPCPGSRTPHPCPRPSAPVPAPHGGWWQGQAAMACPSPARSRAAGGTRAAPASGTSLGTGACQAQAGIGGLQFFLGLKTATYSRGCVVIQSWLWGQGTCGMPAMAAPTGHGPLVCCASFSMPGKHRQPQITLFLKKPLNRAGMTQPFLVSLHRRHVWEEKTVVTWLLSTQFSNSGNSPMSELQHTRMNELQLSPTLELVHPLAAHYPLHSALTTPLLHLYWNLFLLEREVWDLDCHFKSLLVMKFQRDENKQFPRVLSNTTFQWAGSGPFTSWSCNEPPFVEFNTRTKNPFLAFFHYPKPLLIAKWLCCVAQPCRGPAADLCLLWWTTELQLLHLLCRNGEQG